jgi:hypothetical protein
MKYWRGSGSADPCLGLMDPDPAIFVIDLQDANKKTTVGFSDFYFLQVHLHHFSKIKSRKSNKTAGIKVFLFFFLLDDRSIQFRIHTSNGSASRSRRPKNIRIWRIRIRNTSEYYTNSPARHVKRVEEVGNPLDRAGDELNVLPVHPIRLDRTRIPSSWACPKATLPRRSRITAARQAFDWFLERLNVTFSKGPAWYWLWAQGAPWNGYAMLQYSDFDW